VRAAAKGDLFRSSGNARWRGVPLEAVLDQAGVHAGAKQVA